MHIVIVILLLSFFSFIVQTIPILILGIYFPPFVQYSFSVILFLRECDSRPATTNRKGFEPFFPVCLLESWLSLLAFCSFPKASCDKCCLASSMCLGGATLLLVAVSPYLQALPDTSVSHSQ